MRLSHDYRCYIGESEVLGLYSPVSNYSLLSLMKDQLPSTFPSRSRTAEKRRVPCRKLRRGQKVVVRSEDDGLYYPGMQAMDQSI